jgi:hypothetical protein
MGNMIANVEGCPASLIGQSVIAVRDRPLAARRDRPLEDKTTRGVLKHYSDEYKIYSVLVEFSNQPLYQHLNSRSPMAPTVYLVSGANRGIGAIPYMPSNWHSTDFRISSQALPLLSISWSVTTSLSSPALAILHQRRPSASSPPVIKASCTSSSSPLRTRPTTVPPSKRLSASLEGSTSSSPTPRS